MLETVHVFGNRHFIFQDSLMNRMFKRTTFIWNIIFCYIRHVLTVTFDQFNATLQNKSIHFFPNI